MTLFRAHDLVGGLPPEILPSVQRVVGELSGGDQAGGDFWSRFDSILKSLDSMLSKYYAAQGGAAAASPASMESMDSPAKKFDVSFAAEGIFDALAQYIQKIPSPETVTVGELSGLLTANRPFLVAEIAAGLKKVL